MSLDHVLSMRKKTLFHFWADKDDAILKCNCKMKSDIIEKIRNRVFDNGVIDYGAADLIVVRKTFGVVEYEDGGVDMVEPKRIRFFDNKFIDYNWSFEKEDVE